MSQSRRALGQRGEDMACAALKKAGYTIVERNYRRSCGEIDVIARRDGCLYFVEVRTKSSSACGSAAESVGLAKQRQLLRVARVYLAELGREVACEFLVVAIDLESNSLEIISDMIG